MPTPNFHDLPDGSSSINHTGEDFWIEGDYMSETSFTAEPTPAAPTPNPVGYSSQFPPHPSCADGSAPLMPSSHVEGYHNTAIGAEQVARRPQTATEVSEAQRRARINPAWRTATYEMDGTPVSPSQVEDLAAIIDAPRPSPPRRQRPNRRVSSDPDAAIRKDPNAWSLREAVELCKLLEVVLPEAGFHIALTGGLLYKEGRRKDCDLMFYQIRQVEPNYEVLWKYLTVAGVIRDRGYSENGWLVKATYRGKAIDCLFPNAKKKKVAGVFAGPGPSNPASPE